MTPGPVPRKNSPLAVPRSKPLVTGAKLYAQQFAALTHQKFLVRYKFPNKLKAVGCLWTQLALAML